MRKTKTPKGLSRRRPGKSQSEQAAATETPVPEEKADPGEEGSAPKPDSSMATALETVLGIHPRKHPLYKAAMRCLRVLMDHAGLTPELVAEKTDRPVEEMKVVMDEPVLLVDFLMLWELSTEEHEDYLNKCAATVRILLARDEMDTEMIKFLGSIGHMCLVFGGEFFLSGTFPQDA